MPTFIPIVASWSTQPFDHNKYGPKTQCPPFFLGGGELDLHLTQCGLGQGLPTSVPSGILIHTAVSLHGPMSGAAVSLFSGEELSAHLTPPKVNWFGWNLDHSENIVGGWAWQSFSAICAVARAEEPGEKFCQVNNTRRYRFPVGQISRNVNTARRSMSRWILLEQNFENFPIRCRWKMQKWHFWATVCKTVRLVLSRTPVCPVCLSCLWRWCIVAKRLHGSRWNLAWR